MMRTKDVLLGLKIVAIIALAVSSKCAFAQQEQILYSFNFLGSTARGRTPLAGVIFDASGNLYGTTSAGGQYGSGTVFELTPQTTGTWTETLLHSFNFSFKSKDGATPRAGVIFDPAGNLYGTASQGGPQSGGIVFELSPKTGGGWTEKILYSFSSSSNAGGYSPVAGLVLDVSGNLYGTTEFGAGNFHGSVFELSPRADGMWAEKVIHNFPINDTDGSFVASGLVSDAAGDLYGTTFYGGIYGEPGGFGTVFELKKVAGGGWQEGVIHSFGNGADGFFPLAGLVFDAAGNLYGTTAFGGASGHGTVFELSPVPGGGWAEKVLHSFTGTNGDGSAPYGGVALDTAGNIYGTTSEGGDFSFGTVFELSPTASGSWTETVLISFNFDNAGGNTPVDGLFLDTSGNLYGTASTGGKGGGTVFKIIP
jgi:uncharacterized repeat protein (TIGR03803 family)